MPRIAYRAAVALSASLIVAMGACAPERQGAHAPAGDAVDVADTTPIAGREAVLTVYGMSCPLCANNVDKALLDVPGVSGVSVDMGTGHARVTLAPNATVTRGQLAGAIDRSGFSLQRIQTP